MKHGIFLKQMDIYWFFLLTDLTVHDHLLKN